MENSTGPAPQAASPSSPGARPVLRSRAWVAPLCWIAVLLDVVYNHLGPEGNYLGEFGPYFTEKFKTPWGPAVNVDAEHSDGVRRYFIDNALHWFEEYHVDALRLDAVHAILDRSAKHLLAQLAERLWSKSEEIVARAGARGLRRRRFAERRAEPRADRGMERRETARGRRPSCGHAGAG